jgi:hypothetical protein
MQTELSRSNNPLTRYRVRGYIYLAAASRYIVPSP